MADEEWVTKDGETKETEAQEVTTGQERNPEPAGPPPVEKVEGENHPKAAEALRRAQESGALERAIVVGVDSNGKVNIFVQENDVERAILLLERARSKLVASLD